MDERLEKQKEKAEKVEEQKEKQVEKLKTEAMRTGSTQDYLKGLKEKYPDVNITVADFKNGKQEDCYMFGCSGGNNIVISSNIMEQMASDPAVAAKYERYIAEVPEAAGIMKDGIAAHGGEMLACGTAIDRDGKVTYWSIGRHKPPKETQSASYQKTLQEKLEEKRAKKKEEEALKRKNWNYKTLKMNHRATEDIPIMDLETVRDKTDNA